MTFSDEELLGYIDGSLSDSQVQRLQTAMQDDVELQQTIAALEASRLPYRAAYAEHPEPAVPEELRQQLQTWVSLSQQRGETVAARSLWQKWAVVAGLVASFSIGYVVSGVLPVNNEAPVSIAANADNPDRLWVERVADYQSLYVRDTVEGITGGREKADQLLSMLDQKTELSNGIPDLSTQGYKFVRAQQLGFEGAPLVQLVYLSANSTPLALCYMPAEGDDQSELVIGAHSKLGVAYWRHGGQRFVLVADESAAELQKLHDLAKLAWI